jgi:hypothetical protein
MSWEISITAEGWADIREELDTWSRTELIEAITDDTLERVYSASGSIEHGERAKAAHAERIGGLGHETLADLAFGLIERNNTCDNGGWN